MQDELKKRLTQLGFTDVQIGKLEKQGVTTESEMALLSEEELRKHSGCNLIVSKKAVEAFRPQSTTVAEATAEAATIQSILPALPDDESFIQMLKVGGVLKVDRTNVIAAMRAAIASQIGLYALPDTLIARMEAFANEQEEPVGEPFYRLQKQLAERRYGDILAALGTTGSFVSDRRKKETMQRIDQYLWSSLSGFNTQLRSWVETWSQGAANPAMMFMALGMSQGGNHVLPPGMLQPPDTAVLRDEGEAVINQINKVFAGTGIPVARAMAYDAMRIRQVLDDPSLPSTVGAATRDQMLKMLGVDVGADFVRLEQNVTRFALGIMELPKVAAGSDELSYFSALWSLGATVPWDKLGTGRNRVTTLPVDQSNNRAPAYVRGDGRLDR